MAYDEGLAQRIREFLQKRKDVVEKKMFGGLAFMCRGHMCCGVVGSELMVRTGPKNHEAALSEPHARKMDFTGKAMKGFVYVNTAGTKDDHNLGVWIQRALKFVESLPPK